MAGRRDRGSVLVMVIFFSIVMSIVGLATLYFSGLNEMAVRSEIDAARANALADAGVAFGERWLQNVSLNAGFFPENRGYTAGVVFGPYTLMGGSGTYVVRISPVAGNNVHLTVPANSIVGNYLVSSTGTFTTGVLGSMETSKCKNKTFRIYRWPMAAGQPMVGKTVENSYVEGPIRRKVH